MIGFKYLQSEWIYWSKEIPEESRLFKPLFVRKWTKLAENPTSELICKCAFQFLNVLNIPPVELLKCESTFRVLPTPVLCAIMKVANATIDFYYKIWDDLPNDIRNAVFEKLDEARP